VHYRQCHDANIGTANVSTALQVAPGATVNMGGNRVMNVGAPVGATDAANRAYVDASVGNVGTQLNSLSDRVDQAIGSINTRIDDLSHRSDKAFAGVAMAFAMAGVPTVLPQERVAFTLNYGNFQGQNGLALNAAMRLDNHVQFTAGVGYGTNQNLVGCPAPACASDGKDQRRQTVRRRLRVRGRAPVGSNRTNRHDRPSRTLRRRLYPRPLLRRRPNPRPPRSRARHHEPRRFSIDKALLLVRSTLLTLNDANRSGNYTVLRDLAAPEFQAKNTSADLALVFAEMRRNNLSLFGVMLLTPQLEAVPEVDAEGACAFPVSSEPGRCRSSLIWRSRLRLDNGSF